MTKKIPLEYFAFFFVLSMFSFLYLLGQSQSFLLSSQLSTQAILLDLFLTLPIGYFLMIRKTKIPNFTTVYVLLLALLLSGFILPADHQTFLQKIKFFAIPAIEIGIISTVVFKIWKLRKSYSENRIEGLDFYDNLLSATKDIFPHRLAGLISTEISVFYYLYKGKKQLNPQVEEFSYNKKTGISMVIGVILFLVLIETFVVHILIEQWNTTLAWVLTFLSLYTGIQILSILRSMNQRPILIYKKSNQLVLRYGHAAQCTIEIENIKSLEQTRRLKKDEGLILLTPFDMLETPNVILHLKEEQILHKFYGIRKPFASIAIHVDELEKFVKSLEESMDTLASTFN